MKILYLIFCIITSIFIPRLNGQVAHQYFTVEGYVIEDGKNHRHIENALILLHASNGNITETQTDSNGHYSFIVNKDCREIVLTISSDARTTMKGIKHTSFLATKEEKYLVINDSTDHAIADFQLRPVPRCEFLFPIFFFKKNNVLPDTLYTLGTISTKEDSSMVLTDYKLKELTRMLDENNEIVIELSGHCSMDEKDPEQLSLHRAETIKTQLIHYGIDARRLVAKGYAATRPVIKPDVLKKTSSNQKKEALNARNRRVLAKILAWDYVQQK